MNIFQKNAKTVVFFACLAASTSPIFIRLASDMPSLAVGFYRLSFAMPFFIFPVAVWHKNEVMNLSKRQLLGCISAGLFLFLHFMSWFTGIVRTTVASAVVLASLHPIIILIITALIFRKKTNIKIVIGVIIALIGGAIITGGDYSFAGDALLGDFLAFMAAFFMALYFIAGEKFRPGINTIVYVCIVFGCCWFFFFLGMLATNTPFSGYSTNSYIAVFAMAVINQIGTHGLFNWCLGYVSPLYVSTSETVEVVYSSIMAAIIFSEFPTFWQYVGGAVTIIGILIYNYYESRKSTDSMLQK